MNWLSRLMRFLGKDNPRAVEIASFLTVGGCFTLWQGVLHAEQRDGIAFGTVPILLGVLWLVWLVGFATALKALAGSAVVSAAGVLALAGLDRMGLSWLPMVFGIPMLIYGVIVGYLALSDLIEHRFS